PVSNRQAVVTKLWHERREHALEAKAAPEVWMVDVIADNREQVHQTSDDAPQRRGEARQGFCHLLQASALEAGVVRNNRSSGFARPDKVLRERGPRILTPLSLPLVVYDATIRQIGR